MPRPKGFRLTEEHKRKIGLANYRGGRHPKDCPDCGKAIKRTSIRCQVCRMRSIDHPRWKGGGRWFDRKIANAVYREHHVNVICEHCAAPNGIHIHHKDCNTKNNSLDNLMALCNRCHQLVHWETSRAHRKKVKAV